MKDSFPEKTKEELLQLEKEFYRHLADSIIETIQLADMPQEELQRRAFVKNPELISQLVKDRHYCIMVLMGHYANWEWFSASISRFESIALYRLYSPLKIRTIDRLLVKLRTRFEDTFLIKKKEAVTDIVKIRRSMAHCMILSIPDQSPAKKHLYYWTNFLNQDTPMKTGPERIARKLNMPVVFLDVEKVERGCYTINIIPLTKGPKRTSEYWITEQYARLMEKSILRNPALWTWTERHWKFKRYMEPIVVKQQQTNKGNEK